MPEFRTTDPKILQIVGYKNSGKTTLLTKLIAGLIEEFRFNIFTLKHDRHGFAMDREGTDTWKYRQAGAQGVLIQSPYGLGLTLCQDKETELAELLHWVQLIGHYDLLLVEGYKYEAYPKIVLIRSQDDFHLIEELTHIQALAFWQAEDQHHYEQILKGSLEADYPSFLLQDEGEILSWTGRFINGG